jgi:hypothetical protein
MFIDWLEEHGYVALQPTGERIELSALRDRFLGS